MKLNDPGTQINPKVEKRSFKGKEYWVAQVDYEKEVETIVGIFISIRSLMPWKFISFIMRNQKTMESTFY